MARARLKHAASYAVFWAIHYRQQRDYHRSPQPITVREFVKATGYALSSVQQALIELEERRMIQVSRGERRSQATVYGVIAAVNWMVEE